MANDQKQDIDLGITRLEYGDAARAKRAVLEIETGKGSRGIASRADVFWVGGGGRQHCFALGGSGGDFSKRLKVSDARATQSNIDRQHAEVFTPEVLASLTAEARAHYAAVVAAGVDGFRNTYPVAEASIAITTAKENHE